MIRIPADCIRSIKQRSRVYSSAAGSHQISDSPRWERALASAAGRSSPSEPPPTRSATVIHAFLLSENPPPLISCWLILDIPPEASCAQNNVAAFAFRGGGLIPTIMFLLFKKKKKMSARTLGARLESSNPTNQNRIVSEWTVWWWRRHYCSAGQAVRSLQQK